MKKETQVWFIQAEEHMIDAEYMFEGRRYSGTVYFCHQALEKILKAAIIERTNKVPPKLHHLDILLRKSTLIPPKKSWYTELARLTQHFWRVRYPDYRQHVYTSKAKVEKTVINAKTMYLWIKQQLQNI